MLKRLYLLKMASGLNYIIQDCAAAPEYFQFNYVHFANFESFWDVWCIPNPILEALLLNSDWIATADRCSSDFEPPLAPVVPVADEKDFFSLSVMFWNSCVRSLNDCAVLTAIFNAATSNSTTTPWKAIASMDLDYRTSRLLVAETPRELE